ncbi:MAG: uracil-DNA glycosylase family protein [Nitrospiraceae bacterium]
MVRCELCPGKNTCVGPQGPFDADYMFIGEAPGKVENTKGLPFQGSTGREMREGYMPTANIRPEKVFISNAIKCMPVSTDGRLDGNSARDQALLESCSLAHLYQEIDQVKPKLIIPMGVFACRAIDPDINLELQHGIPLETSWGTVFPMFHPAGGVHEPKKMLQIRTDWVRLRRYILGSLVIPQDEYPDPYYREATPYDIQAIEPDMDMACDTETSKLLGPYVMTYTQIPGQARLIRATDTFQLEMFQKKLEQFEAHLIFHNWMYDQKIVGQMGLRFPDKLIRDTMIRAFHLGNIPQGLKALAYRLLGMEMQDFEDLVTPYSRPQVIEYYELAKIVEWAKPEEQLVRDDKAGGNWKIYKPQSMGTKFKRFFTDFEKKPNKDVFKAWDNWEENHEEIEAKLGPWPGLDIAHVPFDEMKHYACRDSDATLRLFPILEAMKDKAHSKIPQENWSV